MSVKLISRLFSFSFRAWAKTIVKRGLRRFGIIVLPVGNHADEGLNLVYKLKSQTSMLQCDHEAYQIYVTVKGLKKIKGDLAEVGVCEGGTAKIMCEAKEDKPLHLFDTFEGIPGVDDVDKSHFYQGQFASSLGRVKEFLKGYKQVYFYKGVFPGTAKGVRDKSFSFVHLDVDIYSSTLDCLQFFYPRMSSGGIIISHDYHKASGVRKAFDEFFKNKREPIIELLGDQCLVEKL